jgi:dihydroorotate dehydrogenase (fumarate)
MDFLCQASGGRRCRCAGTEHVFPPHGFQQNRVDKESIYFKVTEQVTQNLSIPTALKISHYFTDLGPMIQRLSSTGIGGLVLFNRYFSPDIDIDKFEVTNSFVFSTPSDLAMSLALDRHHG